MCTVYDRVLLDLCVRMYYIYVFMHYVLHACISSHVDMIFLEMICANTSLI